MKLLLTVLEYAKIEGISEQGVRKRVVSKGCESITIETQLYIIKDDNVLDKLKTKIKLLSAQVRTLKAESYVVQRSESYVEKLEERVQHLELRLDESTQKKEELYEKVIHTLALPARQ